MRLPGSDALTLQALGELLRERMEAAGEGGRTTISVAELGEWLPYRVCRERLGFATKAEYDLALLHLLAVEERLWPREAKLRGAARKEIDSAEPGLAFLRDFRSSELELRETGPGAPSAESRAAEAGEAEAADEGEAAAVTADLSEAEGRERDPEAEESKMAEAAEALTCWKCDGALPGRPDLPFCPHCGTDQTVSRCASCGEVLEPEWRFCARCGLAVEEESP